VPPPPVSGAAVGYAGADVCVVGAGVTLVWVGLGVDEADACGEPEDEAEAWDELDACGDPDADTPSLLVEVALADAPSDVLDPWPEGDGVRVPDCVVELCPLGDGVKIDGTDEPLLVQAETVTARRTAPAAERPAISHALWAATGGIRRIFMNPPRMRVR
jgi:hypothetical protein